MFNLLRVHRTYNLVRSAPYHYNKSYWPYKLSKQRSLPITSGFSFELIWAVYLEYVLTSNLVRSTPLSYKNHMIKIPRKQPWNSGFYLTIYVQYLRKKVTSRNTTLQPLVSNMNGKKLNAPRPHSSVHLLWQYPAFVWAGCINKI